MNILIVCLGNICRSPMAEGVMRKKITDKSLAITVDSAGTANYHVGEPPDERAIATAKNFGIDISKFRGRQFGINDFDRFDKIFAMDSSNYRNIIKLARSKKDKNKVFYFLTKGHEGSDVPDPWYGGSEEFIHVFELLQKASDKILEKIITHTQE